MPHFNVRLLRVMRVEYEATVAVEAENEEDAVEQAMDQDDIDWDEIDGSVENLEVSEVCRRETED